jgi:hypothetical protein
MMGWYLRCLIQIQKIKELCLDDEDTTDYPKSLSKMIFQQFDLLLVMKPQNYFWNDEVCLTQLFSRQIMKNYMHQLLMNDWKMIFSLSQRH